MLVERTSIQNYRATLKDMYRPPSRGGNTRAWHQHVITIDGTQYSFLALGAKRWVYASDTVSFEWEWDSSRTYRNIKTETLQAWTKAGSPVARGERGTKKWRTAVTRLPARRSEWSD